MRPVNIRGLLFQPQLVILAVGAENFCPLGRCPTERESARPCVRHPLEGFGWTGWDDLRLVGLKLIFLIVSRAVLLLGLSRRESWWKDAEILMLRHQLAVAERKQPRAHARLTWPDRAWLALLAGTLPVGRLTAMGLIVTPGTILRWHRDIMRRRWARRSRLGRSGRPATDRKVRSVVLRLARENESRASAPHPRRTRRARRDRGAVEAALERSPRMSLKVNTHCPFLKIDMA